MSARIIDWDVAAYEAFAEEEARSLYRCWTNQEDHFRARRDAALAVVAALNAYRAAIDGYGLQSD